MLVLVCDLVVVCLCLGVSLSVDAEILTSLARICLVEIPYICAVVLIVSLPKVCNKVTKKLSRASTMILDPTSNYPNRVQPIPHGPKRTH